MSTINTHLHDKNKATQNEAISGSNNDVWMTPLRVLESIQQNASDAISGSIAWGNIQGNIGDQTDLQNQFTQLENTLNQTITTLSGSVSDDFDQVYIDISTQINQLSGSVYTTINDLDTSVNDRITQVSASLQQTIESVDTIINDRIDTEVNDINNTISSLSGSVYSDFQSVDNEQTTQDNRLNSLEQESGSIRTDFESTSGSFDGRIDTLENQPSGVWGQISGSLYDQTDLSGSIDNLQTQIDNITVGSTDWGDIQGNLYDQTDLSGSLAGLQSGIDDKASLTDLNTLSGSISNDLDTKLDVSVHQTFSGSVATNLNDLETSKLDISVYETDSGSFDGRISQNESDILGKASQTDLDNHTNDGTIHFTQGQISITESQISDLDKYTQLQVDNLLDDKVDTTTYNTDSGSFDSRIDSKLDESVYETFSGSVSNELDTKLEDAPSDGTLYARRDSQWESFNTGSTAEWGNISGTLSDQTDLQTALNDKLDTSIYNTDSGSFDSRIDGNSTDIISVSGSVYNHVQDSTIHFTQGQISITESQISDLDKYTQLQVDNLLNDKLDVTTYNIDSGSFDSRIDSKLDESVYTTFSGSVDTQLELKLEDAPSDGSLYSRRDGQWESFTTGSDAVWGQITGTLTDQTDLSGSLSVKIDGEGVDKIILSETEPTSPQEGELWIDETEPFGIEWGEITGSITNQTDLQNALSDKLDTSTYTTDSGSFDTRISNNDTEINNVSGSVNTNTQNISTLDSEKVEGDGTSKITVSTTEPTTPSVGDIWIDIT